jgi:hypothetical protein
LFKELLNFKTKTIQLTLPNIVVNIGQDAVECKQTQDMQIIHYGLLFFWKYLTKNDYLVKMVLVEDQLSPVFSCFCQIISMLLVMCQSRQ